MVTSSLLRPAAALLAVGLSALLACTHPNGDPAPQPPAGGPDGQANAVSGTARDTQGRPVAGAKVRAENNVTHSWAETTTDADGNYLIDKLEFGGWLIYAWKEVTYKGQPYYLRLGMNADADYDAFSPGRQGVVRDFRWQLTGRIADRPTSPYSGAGYFGGALRCVILDADFNTLPAGSEVTLTFTPVPGAILLDGSAPAVVRRSFTVVASSPAQYSYWVQDVPQCEYRLTATSRLNGRIHALQLNSTNATPYQPAIASNYFKPSGGRSYESGLGEGQIPAIYLRD